MVHGLETIKKLHRLRDGKPKEKQMTQWITDRPPDMNDGIHVWIWRGKYHNPCVDNASWVRNAWTAGNKLPWMPIALPDATPPPQRRRENIVAENPNDIKSDTYKTIEVLEGDPHPENVLAVMKEMKRVASQGQYATSHTIRTWLAAMNGENQ